jgi:hypothetical protein
MMQTWWCGTMFCGHPSKEEAVACWAARCELFKTRALADADPSWNRLVADLKVTREQEESMLIPTFDHIERQILHPRSTSAIYSTPLNA